MKQLLYIVIFLLTTLYGQSQVIRQNGVTYRYNGKNPRTPIGGVYIKPITAANGVVSEESSGTFTLALDNLKMGSRIGDVRVTKQGMMVFNQQAVDEWSVRKDPLCLILCDADDFQKQKKNLIEIGESQAKKKYDKKLAELKKQNDSNQLKIDEYYNKLDSLEKEYQNAIKHMNEYADVFARIDESEVDTITQRAIELFNRGEIEESLHLLEQQNYMEKIKQANRTIEQAVVMISTAEQAKSLSEQDKEKYIEGVKTQIAGYKLQNEWDKAKELLKGLADNLNSIDAMLEYAKFCYIQNELKEGELYFLKSEETVRNTEELAELEKLGKLAEIQIDLAFIYCKTQRFIESEEMHKSVLTIIKSMSKSNPQAFKPVLACANISLANLYSKTQRFSESEVMYRSAIADIERISKNNPQVYEPILVEAYICLADLYFSTNRFSESEELYKLALAINKRLAQSNPQAYEPVLAISYGSLANLYFNTQRFSESEELYKIALAINKRLAQANPQAYEPALAISYGSLANLYFNTQRFADSEAMHKQALEIRERLAQSNPQAYEPDLAQSYNSLAILYSNTQRFTESEAMCKQALEIYERLAQSNPQAYEPDLAMSYNNLAILYSDTQRFADSEAMYKQAIEIRKRLTQSNPQAYSTDLASLYYNIGNLYLFNDHLSESEEMFMASLDIYENLTEEGLRYYANNKWRVLVNLSFVSIFNYRFTDAEKYSSEAVKMDSTKIFAYTNLASSLLMQGKYEEAEKIYRQYKIELKDGFLSDFAEFERLGIIPEEREKDVERIKAMLNEP